MVVSAGAPGDAIREGSLYRLLVASVRDYAIFMLDPQGCIVTWNAGAELIKGYSASEIIGKHFSVFYPAEDVAAGKPGWELEIATREGVYEEEGWRLKKDGRRFWASVVITAVHDSGGNLIGFAKVTRDLTERRAAEQQAIADMRRVTEAEAANRTKSEFLRAMSHELRTPINATLGYAQLIDTGVAGPVTDKQREYLRRLRASQQHLLNIVTDMLDYSRLEAGRMTYDITPVSLHDMVATVLPMIGPQLVEQRLVLEDVPCPEGLIALADRTKAEQIVLNLLSNAVKFTPAGGQVTVSCDVADDMLTIKVQDTGRGIPANYHEAIFEPFVQVGRSLTSAHQGTGLGLSVSRNMARAMGGDIVLEQSSAQGSTFAFTLPRAAPSEPASS